MLQGDLSYDSNLLNQRLHDRVTGIAHFAFSDHEGLYQCDQNEDGLNKMLTFIGSTKPSTRATTQQVKQRQQQRQ